MHGLVNLSFLSGVFMKYFMKCLLSVSLLATCALTSWTHAEESAIAVNQRTLSLIKPDAVAADHIGEIIAQFEGAGLHIAGLKMVKLSKEQAQQFYAVHKERPFFSDLTEFVSSGPIVAIVLEGPNAIAKNRELMGATDFSKAAPGTIRAKFAKSVTQNAVHGSDSIETAKEEVAFFFQPNEVFVK
jgi:nucleoside-diphosphate kinase